MQALTVQGLADRWQMSRGQVYNLIRSGELRAFKIGSRGYRVAHKEIERWENGTGADSNDTSETASRSNGEMEPPLPLGEMRLLASSGA